MTRDCDNCGVSYSRSPSLIGKFCSKKCAYTAMRKEGDRQHRRIRRAVGHPLAGPTHLVAEARAVLYEKVGPEPQPCHWCSKVVTWAVGVLGNSPDHVIADHLDSDGMNDSPENLVVACGPCNATRSRRVRDEESYRVRATGTRLRGTPRECEQCGEAFVAWDTKPGRGRFCSRSCARKAPRVTTPRQPSRTQV